MTKILNLALKFNAVIKSKIFVVKFLRDRDLFMHILEFSSNSLSIFVLILNICIGGIISRKIRREINFCKYYKQSHKRSSTQ